MNLNNQTTVNVQEKSNLIWAIADLIRDFYKPHEYGKVILPMTVIKRFNDTLAPTKAKVLETYDKVKHLEVINGFLETASGYQFYNTSVYDFEKLVNDSEHIEENFRDFLNGFSDNVLDILENFEFDREITKLANNGMLFLIVEAFNKPQAYMGADKISAVDMGYIFEDLIKRFSESYDEEAGAHFTSRDIIYLMTDLLVAEDKDVLIEEGVTKTVYDMTMGTSQMLTCMTERLTQLDADADVTVFGQELNPETYAIAKADMLIRGGNSDNMRKGNTLSDDKFSGYKFDYIISNPPFGVDWKVEKKAVEDEAKLGDNGRFSVGLPKISDGQMLFDLNGIAKLKDDGRICINHYINIMHCDFDKDGNAIGGTCKFPLFDFKLIMESIGFNVEKMAIWDDPTVSNFTAWGSWMSASAPNIMTPYEGILIGYKKSWKKLTDGISTIDRETFMEGVSGVWHLGTTTGYTKACFPEKLPRMWIELLSYKNDLVVDPFSGSGTTCYVAKGLDRRYIGFEISRSYHTQSIARLCGAPYKVVKEKVEDTRYKEVDLF